MSDDELKMDVTMKVWNPFIPTDENNSGLPVAGFEYTFKNKYAKEVEAIFSYNSKNFVDIRNGGASIRPIENGFIISQKGTETQPFHQADLQSLQMNRKLRLIIVGLEDGLLTHSRCAGMR